MTSRAGVREQRTGEFRVRAQEADGDRPLRIGSALPLIRLASLVLTLLCVVVAWVTVRANGVLVLATVFAAIHLGSWGVFTRAWWVSDDPEYARIDDELDELGK